MATADIATAVIWNLLQQASSDIGPGGEVPCELRSIIRMVRDGEMDPRVGLDRARVITTYGENEIFLREENVLRCSLTMPVIWH